MRKLFRLSSIVTICFTMFLLTAVLSGCGNKADESVDSYSPPAVPGGSSVATPPGGSGSAPGGPSSNASAPGAQAIDPKAEIAFKEVPNVLGVTTSTVSKEEVSLTFHKFKYTDWQGKVYECELPACEAEGKKTITVWLSTFDVYKKAAAPIKKAEKKSEVKRLHDFPFVSPPPGGQKNAQQQQGGYPAGQQGGQQGGYSGRRPGGNVPGGPGSLERKYPTPSGRSGP